MVKIIRADIMHIFVYPYIFASLKSIGKAEHGPEARVQQWFQYSWQNPAALLEQMAQYKQNSCQCLQIDRSD